MSGRARPNIAWFRMVGMGLVGAGALLPPGTSPAGRGVGVCDPLTAHDHEGHDQERHNHGGQPSRSGKNRAAFEAKEAVDLSPKVEQKLSQIGERFRKKTGKTFIVTSGTRAASVQAELMIAKFEAGDDLVGLYKDKASVGEILSAYQAARAAKKTREQIVQHVTDTIRGQIRRGIFISAHLKAGAADVRSSTMTSHDRRVFLDIAREVGGFEILIESTPPHFHLELQ